MMLNVFTIVLDGMPWLPAIFVELNRLTDIEWRWVVVEGAAMNVRDTAWCAPQVPRLSNDGTTPFLEDIRHHPRITVIQRPRWEGKVAQCNAALAALTTPGVLLEQDADEIWSTDQYRTLVHTFEDDPAIGRLAFDCQYFVGPNIVTKDSVDWHRAWRFEPGDTFKTHEPPVMTVSRGRFENRIWTRRLGLVFAHYSWATTHQCASKGRFYGKKYYNAVTGWQRLQRHGSFPARIKPFFPWSADATMVDRLYAPPTA